MFIADCWFQTFETIQSNSLFFCLETACYPFSFQTKAITSLLKAPQVCAHCSLNFLSYTLRPVTPSFSSMVNPFPHPWFLQEAPRCPLESSQHLSARCLYPSYLLLDSIPAPVRGGVLTSDLEGDIVTLDKLVSLSLSFFPHETARPMTVPFVQLRG